MGCFALHCVEWDCLDTRTGTGGETWKSDRKIDCEQCTSSGSTSLLLPVCLCIFYYLLE